MRFIKLVPVLLVTLLAACASQTDYKPADRRGGYGYTETQLTDNRYRVTFTGNASTPRETVADFALLRAAELTLQNGYDWFKLVDRETDKKTRTTMVDTGVGVGHHHSSVYRRCGLLTCDTVVTHSGHHGGGGVVSGSTRSSYSSAIEIVMGKDPMPEDVETYDAQQLAATLRRWMSTAK